MGGLMIDLFPILIDSSVDCRYFCGGFLHFFVQMRLFPLQRSDFNIGRDSLLVLDLEVLEPLFSVELILWTWLRLNKPLCLERADVLLHLVELREELLHELKFAVSRGRVDNSTLPLDQLNLSSILPQQCRLLFNLCLILDSLLSQHFCLVRG